MRLVQCQVFGAKGCSSFLGVHNKLMSMRLYLGSDHAGFQLKEDLKAYFSSQDVAFVDLGSFSQDPVDYPDIARKVAEKVYEHRDEKAHGILICGTGLGMCIAANKQKGIRAVAVLNEEMAEMGRRHNNANILCLAGRMMDIDSAKKVAAIFLNTQFDTDKRHVRRVNKLEMN